MGKTKDKEAKLKELTRNNKIELLIGDKKKRRKPKVTKEIRRLKADIIENRDK